MGSQQSRNELVAMLCDVEQSSYLETQCAGPSLSERLLHDRGNRRSTIADEVQLQLVLAIMDNVAQERSAHGIVAASTVPRVSLAEIEAQLRAPDEGERPCALGDTCVFVRNRTGMTCVAWPGPMHQAASCSDSPLPCVACICLTAALACAKFRSLTERLGTLCSPFTVDPAEIPEPSRFQVAPDCYVPVINIGDIEVVDGGRRAIVRSWQMKHSTSSSYNNDDEDVVDEDDEDDDDTKAPKQKSPKSWVRHTLDMLQHRLVTALCSLHEQLWVAVMEDNSVCTALRLVHRIRAMCPPTTPREEAAMSRIVRLHASTGLFAAPLVALLLDDARDVRDFICYQCLSLAGAPALRGINAEGFLERLPWHSARRLYTLFVRLARSEGMYTAPLSRAVAEAQLLAVRTAHKLPPGAMVPDVARTLLVCPRCNQLVLKGAPGKTGYKMDDLDCLATPASALRLDMLRVVRHTCMTKKTLHTMLQCKGDDAQDAYTVPDHVRVTSRLLHRFVTKRLAVDVTEQWTVRVRKKQLVIINKVVRFALQDMARGVCQVVPVEAYNVLGAALVVGDGRHRAASLCAVCGRQCFYDSKLLLRPMCRSCQDSGGRRRCAMAATVVPSER